MAKNYYSVKDTTYHTWNDNQIRRWAVSRGLIRSENEKKIDQSVFLLPGLFLFLLLMVRNRVRDQVADKYYSLRDAAWSTWDDSMLKHWLHSKGIIKSDYEAKRDESVILLLQVFLRPCADTTEFQVLEIA
jgi:hypothetical protein